MNCCKHCQEAGDFFDDKMAKKELKQYQKNGPPKATRLLIDHIRQTGVANKTLLDVGGGVGAIQHELFQDGLKAATQAEASQAYIDVAEEEAERLGHRDRLTSFYGDFVELSPQLHPADIVTLDRVVCCYPYMEKLVKTTIAKTNEICGLVYPRKTLWTKLSIGLGNLYFWLSKKDFRLYLHDPQSVDALFQKNGFQRYKASTTFLWHVDVYRKLDAEKG